MMGVPARKSLPTWYLLATNDEAIPPEAEAQFAKDIGATSSKFPRATSPDSKRKPSVAVSCRVATAGGKQEGMSLRTAFTEMFSIAHPVASAPMGGSAGEVLAAVVSNGGGLGLVGGGRGEIDWLDRELALVTDRTDKPWGVGFPSWSVDPGIVEWALERRPAIMLSFGDPGPLAERVKRAGVKLVIQVTNLEEARTALDAGADIVIAQGTEAGGHGGGRATLPFVPAVVDERRPNPVERARGWWSDRWRVARRLERPEGWSRMPAVRCAWKRQRR